MNGHPASCFLSSKGRGHVMGMVMPQPSIPDTSVELSEQLAKSSHVAASGKGSADVPFHAAVMTDISDVDALNGRGTVV